MKDDESWALDVRATRPLPRCGQVPRHSRVAVKLPGAGVDRIDCPCPKGTETTTRLGPIQQILKCHNESDIRHNKNYDCTFSSRNPGDSARSARLARGMPQVLKRCM